MIYKIEAIGDDGDALLKGAHAFVGQALGKEMADTFVGRVPPSYWIARITGLDGRFGFAREFLCGRKDYSQANSKGSRGIQVVYDLEPERIYEINERITWKRRDRRFCIFDEAGNETRLSKAQVEERFA